jgi:Bacterial Ig-like domain (group 2)/Bacterial pre-peptidase C-terminal domain
MHTRSTLRTLGVLFLTALAACESGTSGPAVDTVIIEADASEVAVDETLQLQATAFDENGNEITGRSTTWRSSNTNVATVSASGVLTGVAPGSVEISAEIGGRRDSQTFDVYAACPQAAYTIGATVNGTLAQGDCAFDDGTRVDLYRFTLATQRQVTITLRSTAFDAYLVLFDATGAAVDEDDDGAGGTDARITATLPAGTYTIGANSYEPATGAYTLTSQ